MLTDVTTSGALPALEMMIKFAGGRQRLIANNIANLETPGFIARDVSPQAFQRQLADAVERRRDSGATSGDLNLRSGGGVSVDGRGAMRFEPTDASGGILYHDRTNRDIERTMQSLVENAAAFRVATELYNNRMALMRAAVSERV